MPVTSSEQLREEQARCEAFITQRSPDRRWRIVTRLLESQFSLDAQSVKSDPFIRQAYRVEKARRAAHTSRIFRGDGEVFAAIELGLSASGQSDLTKAFLLAGQTPSEVASLTGQSEGVIVWFERLFFDVRERLDACDWIWAFILVPANHVIDEFETGSPEYARAIDRAVLFDVAYRGGMDLLKRVVRPADDLLSGTNRSLLADSPAARVVKWLLTSNHPLMTYVLVHECAIKLLRNESSLCDQELDLRFEVLAKFIEHVERKRTGRKQTTCRAAKAPLTADAANIEQLTVDRTEKPAVTVRPVPISPEFAAA